MTDAIIVLSIIGIMVWAWRRPSKRPAYDEYLRSHWWRWLVRPMRLTIDRRRCVACHSRRRLQVHHASYKRRGTWLFWLEVADTITLCNSCHEGVHSRQPIKEFAD